MRKPKGDRRRNQEAISEKRKQRVEKGKNRVYSIEKVEGGKGGRMRDGDEAHASREKGAETMPRQTRPSGAQGGWRGASGMKRRGRGGRWGLLRREQAFEFHKTGSLEQDEIAGPDGDFGWHFRVMD